MSGSENGASTARTAAVAAASSAAVIAARHVLGRSGSKQAPQGGAVSTGLEAAWEAARDNLLPMLEEGAVAAGRYVAEHAPEVVRETIVPRFLHGFHEASERRDTEATDDD